MVKVWGLVNGFKGSLVVLILICYLLLVRIAMQLIGSILALPFDLLGNESTTLTLCS
jgi:hypothetical protein